MKKEISMKEKFKIIFVFLILMNIIWAVDFKVYAAESIYFHFTADETIKIGKDFNIYLTISADENMGAVRAVVDYDKSLLEFSSASLEDKKESDYFHYEEKENSIIFIYTNHEDRIKSKRVKLRFKQNHSENQKCVFTAGFYEACDQKGNDFSCYSVPRLELNIKSEGTEVEKSLVDNHIIIKNSEAESSFQNQEESILKESKIIRNTEHEIKEYSIASYEDSENDKTNIFIGFGIIVAAAMLIAYKYGKDSKKH